MRVRTRARATESKEGEGGCGGSLSRIEPHNDNERPIKRREPLLVMLGQSR